MKRQITFNQLKMLVREETIMHGNGSMVSGKVPASAIDDAFIDELRGFTDANEHAEAYKRVAEKCAELGNGSTAAEVYEEYAKVFGTIAEHENGGTGDFYLRYAVEKTMFDRIREDFGKKFVDRLNKGL